MFKKVLALTLAVFASLGPLSIPASADSLGIGVTVVPDSGNPSVDSRSLLWFGARPGEEAVRRVVVSSASAVEQKITFTLLDQIIVDGEEYVDSNSPSEKNEWLSISPTSAILEPGERREFELRVLVPADAEETTTITFLRVRATSSSGGPTENDTGESLAIIQGAVAVDVETWIGVGDPELLLPRFEMLVPRGILRGDQKIIAGGFRNVGSIPLVISGKMTLADQTFEGRTLGPFDFRVAGTLPGEDGNFEVEVPEEVQEGPWQIYITAQAGNIRENRIFTLNLTFEEEGGLDLRQLVWPAAILLLVAILVVARRMIVQGRQESSLEQEPSASTKISLPKLRFPKKQLVEEKTIQPEYVPRFDRSKVKEPLVRVTDKTKSLETKDRTDFDISLDSWAESLRSSIREVRSDSTDLVEKYKDVPTRKPRKTKPKD